MNLKADQTAERVTLMPKFIYQIFGKDVIKQGSKNRRFWLNRVLGKGF